MRRHNGSKLPSPRFFKVFSCDTVLSPIWVTFQFLDRDWAKQLAGPELEVRSHTTFLNKFFNPVHCAPPQRKQASYFLFFHFTQIFQSFLLRHSFKPNSDKKTSIQVRQTQIKTSHFKLLASDMFEF